MSLKRQFVVRGYNELDDLIIYSQQESLFFLGCLPGSTILLHNVILKPSRSSIYGIIDNTSFITIEQINATDTTSNVYLPKPDLKYASSATNLSVANHYPSSLSAVPLTVLIDLYKSPTLGKSVFKAIVSVREVISFCAEFRCSKCRAIILNHVCPGGCNKGIITFSANLKCVLDDGSATVKATIVDDRIQFNLLHMDDR